MVRKFWLFYLVLLIEGGALMSVELLGAKFVAPFYGSSLYVWTAVLGITVLGLTFGYYFGGKLSRKKSIENILFCILFVSSIVVFALPYTSIFSVQLTKNFSLIPGICITSLVLLVPPMFCFGMVGPITVSLIAKELKNLGKTAGTVYFISTVGGIIVTFFLGFYLIPVEGLIYCSQITAGALLLLPVIYLCKKLIQKNEITTTTLYTQNIIISDTTDKKSSQVANTLKLKSTVYLFAALEGAAVMAIELITARMIAPYFGASLFVWGAVIGATLFSLAIGYYLGGFLADKFTQINTLYWSLLIAAVFILLQHFFSQQLVEQFAHLDPRNAAIIVSFILLLPPIISLGMVPTLLIRYISTKIDDAGTTTGNVYTLSSISGIITLLVIGFFIIPEYGLTAPSIWIGFLVGIVPFVKLIFQKKYFSLLFLLILVVSISIKKVEETSPDVEIQYFSEGLLGQVLVADINKITDGVKSQQSDNRILFVNRMGQSLLNRRTGNSTLPYVNFAASIASKAPSGGNALLLGLGGGSLANIFANGLNFSVDAVELDERISEVSKDYFFLTPKATVIVDDARHYLETCNKKYDLIFFDVFKGDILPAHVLTLETFKKAKSLLNKDGLLIVNFNGFLSGNIGKPGRSVYKTICAAGFDTKIFPTPGIESERNTLFIASEQPINFSNLRSPLLHLGKPVNLDSMFISKDRIELNDAFVFTDDKSDLELLNIPAGLNWRNTYTKFYTKMFSENGIPLFK